MCWAFLMRRFPERGSAVVWNSDALNGFLPHTTALKEDRMRSVLLWLIGVPIPIILLLALCTHHF
jgi:hypothetical protein